MSAAPQGSAELPLIVDYWTIRQRHGHEDKTPEGSMRIRSKPRESVDEHNLIPCEAKLKWATWHVDFKCTYNQTTDRFHDFEDTSMVDTSGLQLEFEDEGLCEPPGAMCSSQEEVDDNGHPFLKVGLFFNGGANDRTDAWDEEHQDWQMWLKRARGAPRTITDHESARLEAAGSSPCDYCEERKEEEEEEEDDDDDEGEGEGEAEPKDKDVGVEGGSKRT